MVVAGVDVEGASIGAEATETGLVLELGKGTATLGKSEG
jgi:hypothetical protein